MRPGDKRLGRLAWLISPGVVTGSLVCIMLSQTWSTPSLAADSPVIAFDDFESGSFLGGAGWADSWSFSGAADIVATEGPLQGVRHLRLRGWGQISRSVSRVGYSEMELGFWAKARSLEALDTVRLEASVNGSSWELLEEWSDDDDDDRYHLYEFDLEPSGVGDSVFLRFVSSMDQPGDFFYLDDVVIRGGADSEDTDGENDDPDEPGIPLAVPRSLATSSGGIVIDSLFSDWAGYPNLPDPQGDADEQSGDVSAFYWGNNGGAEVNYWMIERYPATGDDDEDDEGEEGSVDDHQGDDEDEGDGSQPERVKYTIYIDTDNDGTYTGENDRRVFVDYEPRDNDSQVTAKVKAGSGGLTFYSATGDWGESRAEGGRRVELGVLWEYLGISKGDVLRMYVESDQDDRLPDSGDIQWSPASILGFWLLAFLVALGGVALWHTRKRRERACLSG